MGRRMLCGRGLGWGWSTPAASRDGWSKVSACPVHGSSSWRIQSTVPALVVSNSTLQGSFVGSFRHPIMMQMAAAPLGM